MAVQISTEIYKKGSVYYKDQACNSPFSDQKAAKVLWRQKYGASFGESLVGVAKLVGFLLLLSGAINLWEFSAREGWRSHDELITVDGRNWANGEYKDCSSLNPKNTGLT